MEKLYYISGGLCLGLFLLGFLIIFLAERKAYKKYGFKPKWKGFYFTVYFFSKESEEHEDIMKLHKLYIWCLFAWVFFGFLFFFSYFVIEALNLRDSGGFK